MTENSNRLDLAGVRAKLASAAGKEYWRSLDELAETPEFADFLSRELPGVVPEWRDAIGRRKFLQLMGASLSLAGLSACAAKRAEDIVPYVRQPEEITPGEPLYFATAMTLSGIATGLLVQSREGRPVKIEGNPLHPDSLGATDAFAQASILTLYDPERSQVVTKGGAITTWSAFFTALNVEMEGQRLNGGAGLRILSEGVVSPTLADQMKALLTRFPRAKWHRYEPAGRDNARAGAKLAFGEYADAQYRLADADVIVAFDGDFLACGGGRLRLAREFAARRRVRGGKGEMNRLYAVESTPSITGSVADHRLPLRPSELAAFAAALASRLGVSAAGAAPAAPAVRTWIEAVARDLEQHRGRK